MCISSLQIVVTKAQLNSQTRYLTSTKYYYFPRSLALRPNTRARSPSTHASTLPRKLPTRRPPRALPPASTPTPPRRVHQIAPHPSQKPPHGREDIHAVVPLEVFIREFRQAKHQPTLCDRVWAHRRAFPDASGRRRRRRRAHRRFVEFTSERTRRARAFRRHGLSRVVE